MDLSILTQKQNLWQILTVGQKLHMYYILTILSSFFQYSFILTKKIPIFLKNKQKKVLDILIFQTKHIILPQPLKQVLWIFSVIFLFLFVKLTKKNNRRRYAFSFGSVFCHRSLQEICNKTNLHIWRILWW